MGFVIKMTHRKTGESLYFGGVQRGRSKEGVSDVEVARFYSLWEASLYPFPDEEHATAALGAFPQTRNMDYEVVEAGDDGQ